MRSETSHFDPARSSLSSRAGDGLARPAGSEDWMATIGYEAANPMLQAPLWLEAMQDQPDARSPA